MAADQQYLLIVLIDDATCCY